MGTAGRRVAVVVGLLSLALVFAAAFPATAQRGRGWGRGPGGPGGPGGRGPMADPQFAQDRDGFHFLLANRDKIRREVTEREDGVATVTESDDPQIAARIQEHVAAMARRVEERQPIHMRDPLFAEVFRHADKIKLEFDKTERGVRVVETSSDPYVARLIKAHAEVVNLFVKNGFEEAQRNHALPAAAVGGSPASSPATPAAAGSPAAACAACGGCANAESGCNAAGASSCPVAEHNVETVPPVSQQGDK